MLEESLTRDGGTPAGVSSAPETLARPAASGPVALRKGRERVVAALKDVLAALAVTVITVAYSASFAVFLFSGPLAVHAAHAFGAVLVGSGIVGIMAALLGTSRVTISAADTPAMAVLATALALLCSSFAATDPRLLPTALLFIAMASLVTGSVLFLLGYARMTAWLRFVPYPVIMGFIAASGWFLVMGALRVVAGPAESLLPIDDPDWLGRLGLTLATCATLAAGQAVFSSRSVLPLLLVGLLAAVLIGFEAAGLTLLEARMNGWLLSVPGSAAPFDPILWLQPDSVSVMALLPLLPELVALVCVVALAILMNTTAYETATEDPIDLDREFRANGAGNLLSGMAGGLIGNFTLNRSLLNRGAGATGRLSGVVAGVACLGIAATGTVLLEVLPAALPGGLLLFIGLQVLRTALIDTIGRLSLLEYLLAIAMVAIIALLGFLGGVLLGVLVCCILFIVNYARVPFMSDIVTREACTSHVERPSREARLLRTHGQRIAVFRLQQFFFFGTAQRLLDTFRSYFAQERSPEPHWAIIDFRGVTGMDSSARQTFKSLRRLALAAGVTPVFCGLQPAFAREFRQHGIIGPGDPVFSDPDSALEHCEDALLRSLQASGSTAPSLEAWLAAQLMDPDVAGKLSPLLKPRHLAPGELICAEGSVSEVFYILLSGRIRISTSDGRVRLRSMVGPTIVGEMGYFTGARRSATVTAETACELYEIGPRLLGRLGGDNPLALEALHRLVIRTLADRLSFANRIVANHL